MLNDILTVASAIASIVSLFIAIGDKFPAWKKYASSASWLLGGFFVGRVSSVVPVNSQLFSDGYSSGLLVIIIGTVAIVSLFAYFISKKGDLYGARVIFIIGLMTLVPTVANVYSNLSVSIAPEDYLILVNAKEQRGENGDAIKYLEAYKSKVSNNEIHNRIDQRIEKLQEEMLRDNHSKQ